MLAPFAELLDGHRRRGSALVSFTCYNLETATGVLAAADELGVGVVLLIAQKAFRARSGPALLVALRAAAEVSKAPACVQLDHTDDLDQIRAAFDLGAGAVMADGSRLPLDDNVAFVRDAAAIATAHGGSVEAELGRIEGDEDVAAAAAAGLLTDPAQAADFVRGAGPACLAVSIGNVHGVYRDEPCLDWDRLTRIGAATGVSLSLHGSSGLPDADLRRAVRTGVCKINLNTELRQRYLQVTADRLASAQDGWRVLELNRAVADGIRAIALDKLLVAGAGR